MFRVGLVIAVLSLIIRLAIAAAPSARTDAEIHFEALGTVEVVKSGEQWFAAN
jgi:hypothetical protein